MTPSKDVGYLGWVPGPGDRFLCPPWTTEPLLCKQIEKDIDGNDWALTEGGFYYPASHCCEPDFLQALASAIAEDLAEAKSWIAVEAILEGLPPEIRKQAWITCSEPLKKSLWAMKGEQA